MPDTQMLNASLGADVTSFQGGMQSAVQALMQTVGAMNAMVQQAQHVAGAHDKTAAAVHEVAKAHEESAGAIGRAVEVYHLVGEAVLGAAEKMKQFGEVAIEAANEMDPVGAVEWTASVEGLKSSFLTFAGALGKEVRPAIESILKSFTGVFDSLAKIKWHEVKDAILSMVGDTNAALKPALNVMLDILTSPWRVMLATAEASMAGMLRAVGAVTSKLGGTALGQKLGFSAFAGDTISAVAETMTSQAAKIAGSFSGAAQIIGTNIKDLVGAALESAANTSGGRKLLDALHGGGAGGEKVETAQQLGMRLAAFQIELKTQQDIFKAQQQADQDHIAQVRQGAMLAKQGAMEAFDAAKQLVLSANSKLNSDSSAGNVFGLAGDQKALAEAISAMNAAGTSAIAASSAAAAEESALAAKLSERAAEAKVAYAEARAAANAADRAAAAAPTALNALLKTEADARAAMIEQEKDALVGQYLAARQAAARLTIQAESEGKNIRLAAAHEAAAIQVEAAKRSTDFYTKTTSHLVERGLGATGGAALQGGIAGFTAAGPIGAAVGAAAALLEASEGFKRITANIEGIFQSAADAVGSILAPLAPALEALHGALGPVLGAITKILTPVGQIISSIVQPAAGIISVVATVASLLLQPFVLLLQAIAPLIGPIAEIAALMLIASVALNPLMAPLLAMAAAAELLKPLFVRVAGVMNDWMKVASSWWNSVILALQKFITDVAKHLPDFLGDPLRDVAGGLDGFKLAVSDAGGAVQEFSQSIRAAVSTAQGDAEKQAQLKAAVEYAKSNHDSKAVVDALQKQLDQATAKLQADILRAMAEAAKSRGDTAGYYKLMGEALAFETAANTAAVKANTTALTSLNNAPTGFKVAAYEQQFATSSRASRYQGQVGSGSVAAVSITGPITIQVATSDPDAAAKLVEKALRNLHFKSGGAPVMSTSGKFA